MFEGNRKSGNIMGGMDAQARWEQERDKAYDENVNPRTETEVETYEVNSDNQNGFPSDEERRNFFQSLRDTLK